MASQAITKIRDFIEHARKLGKYPRNTAVGALTAVRIVEQGVLPNEPDDLHYISEHLEEIYHRQMDKLSLSSASLETYIGRVKKVLSDYQQHGSDPKAMLAWKPRIVQRGPRTRSKEDPAGAAQSSSQVVSRPGPFPAPANGGLRTLTWSLRPDLDIHIQLPRDLTEKDVERLTKLLKLEAELSSDNQ